MAQFPALNLWTDSWLADTAHLKRDARDIYFHLLILMWRTPGCRIPNQIGWIADRLFCTEQERKILQSLISEFCKSSGNWVTQKRLTKEFRASTNRSKKASVSAKLRWKKDKHICDGNATTTTTTTTTTDTIEIERTPPTPQGGDGGEERSFRHGRKPVRRSRKHSGIREAFFEAVEFIERRPVETGRDESGDEGRPSDIVMLPGLRESTA